MTQNINWFAEARNRAIQTNLATPLFSNIGLMHDQSILFGECEALGCYFVSPCFYAPGFMAAASSYNGVLTLTVGFYQSTARKNDVEAFLDQMVDDLNNL